MLNTFNIQLRRCVTNLAGYTFSSQSALIRPALIAVYQAASAVFMMLPLGTEYVSQSFYSRVHHGSTERG